MADRHYLDHASTTPLRPEARAAFVDAISDLSADPARLYHEALATRRALEAARDQVAERLGCRSRSVVFTSGATESIATATAAVRQRVSSVAIADIEHSAVRSASDRWFRDRVRRLPVDGLGHIDAEQVADADDDTLVHLQWANHEIGTIQHLSELVEAAKAKGALVHVDAAMSAGRIPTGFDELGADLLSLSGHKLGGPAGIGVLLVRRGLRIDPLLTGGDQERARRAGLENTAAAVGLAAALRALDDETIAAESAQAATHMAGIEAALSSVGGTTMVGDPARRLNQIRCAIIEGVEPQAVVLGLDRRGIAVHSGSACASEAIEPSPVLAAVGAAADRSLRVSTGWSTTAADVEAFAEALPLVIAELRSLARSG